MGEEVRTVRELAARLGLAHSTVSMALRNDPKIALKTRDRVRSQAEAMGYVRNPLVASLMTQVKAGKVTSGRMPLAMLLTGPEHLEMLNSYRFFQDLQRSLHERSHRLGYYLEPFFLSGQQGLRLERLRSILRARNIVGVLLPPGHWDSAKEVGCATDVQEFFEGLAAITIAFSWRRPDLHRASPDHGYNARLAFDHLRRIGTRRIGLVISDAQAKRVDHAWMGGMYLAQRGVAVSDRLPPLELKPWDPEALRNWVREHKPDGIVCVEDQVIEILEAEGLGESGGKGPLVAHLDVNSTKRAQRGIDQQPGEIGAAAIDMLISQINARAFDAPAIPRVTLVRGRWVDDVVPAC